MKKSLNSPELKAGKAGRPMSSNAVESITEVSRTNSASRVGKPVLMSIRDLSFSYQDRPLDTVLSHLDLDIFEGECLAILGASGSGKTTLLKLLCGLMRPDSGQIRYRGQQLAGSSNEIAMIFQNYGLFPWKTVRENVLLPLRLRREPASGISGDPSACGEIPRGTLRRPASADCPRQGCHGRGPPYPDG